MHLGFILSFFTIYFLTKLGCWSQTQQRNQEYAVVILLFFNMEISNITFVGHKEVKKIKS